jgi:hypothetical protein
VVVGVASGIAPQPASTPRRTTIVMANDKVRTLIMTPFTNSGC